MNHNQTHTEPSESDLQAIQKSKRTAFKVVGITLTSIILFVISIGVGMVLYIANALQPVVYSEQTSNSEVVVGIPSGAKVVEIIASLKENELIRDERVFHYYLKIKSQGSRFKAGEYLMVRGMTFDEIIDKLNRGDVIKVEMKRVTIPEGLTVVQIAEKIAEGTSWSAEVFQQNLENPELFPSTVLADLPLNDQIKYPLEGYLFPDTYDFKVDETEQELIQRMLQELENKLATLPEDWRDQIAKRGLNVHEILTIASMIEREVSVEEEREIVAGVIYNRLAENMPLQLDATVQYALDKPKERLFEVDLRVNSPYNTYLNTGLPPGPIASPSLLSIEAAIYPAKTEYYYYVTKKDGTSAHLFAKTYKEHLKNIVLSKKNISE